MEIKSLEAEVAAERQAKTAQEKSDKAETAEVRGTRTAPHVRCKLTIQTVNFERFCLRAQPPKLRFCMSSYLFVKAQKNSKTLEPTKCPQNSGIFL